MVFRWFAAFLILALFPLQQLSELAFGAGKSSRAITLVESSGLEEGSEESGLEFTLFPYGALPSLHTGASNGFVARYLHPSEPHLAPSIEPPESAVL